MWMQKTGLEWLFRLAQEPRRLLSRYANDLFYFGGGIAAQYCRFKLGRKSKARAAAPIPVTRNIDFSLIEMPERLDFEAVQQERESIEKAISGDRPCLVALEKVEFIDSTGVGLLVRLQKKARIAGQPLFLVNPSRNLLRALKIMRLDEFFTIVPDRSAAMKSLQNAARHSAVQLKTIAPATLPTLSWKGELTAENAEEIWVSTMDHLSARSIIQDQVTIDLSEVDFMDSTGLGIMIRAKKFAARQGMKVNFTGCGANVLNVIRLSRLEDYLLKAA